MFFGCVFLIAHYFSLFFSYLFMFFLLIASFAPEKHKSLLYKIRNPKAQPPPLSIKSDTPKNSSPPPASIKLETPQKSTPPSIKLENVLSRLNLGPIQKHTKTMWKTMLKTIPLNWSTECFRTDCGYNLLKEIIFKKISKKIKKNTKCHNTNLQHMARPEDLDPKTGRYNGEQHKGKRTTGDPKGGQPNGEMKKCCFYKC